MTEEQSRESETKVINPTLQFFVLCDNVAQVATKPVFVGVFDHLPRPGVLQQFIIAMRWINGLGKHKARILILNPSLAEIASFENEFELLHRAENATHIVNVLNFGFPSPGVYWFHVHLDANQVAAIPLPVYAAT